jgi:hypothetical protein
VGRGKARADGGDEGGVRALEALGHELNYKNSEFS